MVHTCYTSAVKKSYTQFTMHKYINICVHYTKMWQYVACAHSDLKWPHWVLAQALHIDMLIIMNIYQSLLTMTLNCRCHHHTNYHIHTSPFPIY